MLSAAQLSEWHSGYRIYRVSELDRLRFHNNSNGFSFDTEIITQLLSAGCANRRVALFPRTTGDEICRVEGVRYAVQAMRSCLRHTLHRLRVRPVRALMPKASGNIQYDGKVEFDSSHSEALQARACRGVGSSTWVLGPGFLASAIADRAAAVATADLYPPVIHDPRVVAFTADLNEPTPSPVDEFQEVLRWMLSSTCGTRSSSSRTSDTASATCNRASPILTTTERGLPRDPADAAVRPVQLRRDRNPRPDAYAAVHQVVVADPDHGRRLRHRRGGFGSRRRVRRWSCNERRLASRHVPNPLAPASRVAPRLFAYQFLAVARNRQTTAHILATTRASAYVEAA